MKIERRSVDNLQHELASSSKRVVSLEGAVSSTKKHVGTIAYIAKKAIGSSDRTFTVRRVLIFTAVLGVLSRAFPRMAILVRTAIQQLLKNAIALTASSAKSNFAFLISAIVSKLRIAVQSATVSTGWCSTGTYAASAYRSTPVAQGDDIDEEELYQAPSEDSVTKLPCQSPKPHARVPLSTMEAAPP